MGSLNIVTLSVAGLSLCIGYIISYIIHRPKHRRIELKAAEEASKITKKAEKSATQTLRDAEKQAEMIRSTLQKEETKTQKRLDTLQEQFDARMAKREKTMEEKIDKLDESKVKYDEQTQELKEKKREFEEKIGAQDEVLEKVAKYTKEQARKEILDRMETELAPKMTTLRERKLKLMREESDKEGSNIIVQSIQRLASGTTSESTTSVIKLKSDDLKGKIIGREGRNINAFEMVTGVDLIIDDSPGTVTISSFDMFRRFVAKVALEELLKDGRIHPASIEAAVEKAESRAEELLINLGREACEELNLVDMFPEEILKLVGRLRFRTSYGQNVLAHSKEVAWLAEGIAQQLPGADPLICRKAGLVHDIGKAVSHEVEGGHAIIGKEILEKFGIEKPIVQAMMSHHEDFPYETLEARILQAADAISASRPGARRETIEKYIKRLKALENIAQGFEGVKKAFCIQAGREVRVFVDSGKVDDNKAKTLSFNMAREIEKKADYPGEVKVTLIREQRFVNRAK